MSNPNDLATSFVAMARAFEELPQIKAELKDAKHYFSEANQRIVEREESILKLKQEIEDLHATTRKLEAERDDAEYRFLESEDRTKQALNFIRSTFGSAGSLIQALEPPAPAPVPMPPAEAEVIHQPMGDPMQDTSAYGGAPAEAPEVRHEEPVTAHYWSEQDEAEYQAKYATELVRPAPVGQSADLPIAAETSVSSNGEVTTSDADPTTAPIGSQDGSGQNALADDVGYHNEPDVSHDWQGWNQWCDAMSRRYPYGWPMRPEPTLT